LKMRAAIYGRVSSERQEKEHTIGSQLEALRAYAAKNGLEIVEEFTDEGYSGARLDRPALDRMRDLAERRGFEVLLTYCTDRLARKFVLQALILDELERFGVKTIFLIATGSSPEPPIGLVGRERYPEETVPVCGVPANSRLQRPRGCCPANGG